MDSSKRASALKLSQAAVVLLSGSPLRRVRYCLLQSEDDEEDGVWHLEDWDDRFLHTATMGVEFETDSGCVFFTWELFSWTDDPGDYALLADERVDADGLGLIDVSGHCW